MSASRPSRAERVLAAAIYAPIGLGAQLVDEIPAVATKARQHVVFARFIGKMAVDQGVRELRSRLAPPCDTGHAPVNIEEPDTAVVVPDEPQRTVRRASEADRVEPVVPTANDLALPDYDQLPAAHIIGKLGGLTSDELAVIEVYEQAHRHRRTVLGKISRLREG